MDVDQKDANSLPNRRRGYFQWGNYRNGYDNQRTWMWNFQSPYSRRRHWAKTNQMRQACLTTLWEYSNNAKPMKSELKKGTPIMMPCQQNGIKNGNGHRRREFRVVTWDHYWNTGRDQIGWE